MATGALIGQPIDTPVSTNPSAVTGTRVGFIGLSDTSILYWRFAPEEWHDLACRLAGRNLTKAEWDHYGPRDQTYRATCTQWSVDT